VHVLMTTASTSIASRFALASARSADSVTRAGACVAKRACSVSGSIANTSSSESSASRRASMPLSRSRTVSTIRRARSSTRSNHAELLKARQQSALV
jgi:hypothetical protein